MDIKGFTYGYDSRKGVLSRPEAKASVARLAAVGCNYAALAFTVTQERFSSSRFGFDFRFCNTDREIETAIANIKAHGMKVCLKPMINCEDGTWRAHISFPEREFPVYDAKGNVISYWNEWFSCYSAFMLHYAEIAEYTGCEMLCIGCEMIGTERREAQWRELIEKVRQVYHGLLVYNANHGKEDNVAWFDALDYIGTSAYYRIGSPQGGDTLEAMTARWEEPKKHLRELSERFGKKIIFMEIGCRSAEKCASMPWDFVHTENARSEDEQANFYESALIAMKDEDFFEGFFWWDWPSIVPPEEKLKEDRGFMICGKKTERLLTEYYSRI